MPAPAKLPPDALRQWATAQVAAHGADFTAALAGEFGVSRVAANGAVQQLEREGFVRRTRGGTRPTFEPGPSRLVAVQCALPGVDESLVWEQAFAPWLTGVPANVLNIAHYGFTELLNNANDHSGGSQVTLRCALTFEAIYLWISDDGEGVFAHLCRLLGLADLRLAQLQLTKGKLTTAPAQHSGEGLFFTSRAFEHFELRANGLTLRRHNPEANAWPALDRGADATASAPGTQVFLALPLDARHSLRQVFDHYTSGAPEDLSFDRTVVPVKLALLGTEQLLSRSQARRLTSGLEPFRFVDVDFDGIDEIGQAFADELFRVHAMQHPDQRLSPVRAAPRVLAMIRRVAPSSR